MSVLEKAMQDPNSLADRAFIEEALSELENDIVYIERGHNVTLVGDRADFDKARRDWLHLTKIQVAYAVSYWRAGIFKRYSRKYVWQTGIYAYNTSILPKWDLLKMLRNCNPRILMDEDERMVYAVLPDELTLYRGVNPYNKQFIKSPSWTLNPANVRVYYSSDDRPFDSCNGKAYTAKIQKQDVFAYFQYNTQVIVHPDKLYEIDSYWLRK